MSVATASSPNYDVPRPSAECALRLEAWYHGQLTRVRAESLVRAEGDFLVRDSISSKGDFVLTVFWKGRAIHFQINRISSSNSSTGFLFQFEDEQFESVSDLISFYQSHRRAVTLTSGCIISNPVSKSNSITNIPEPYKEIEENYVKMFFPQRARNGIDRCLSQQVLLNQASKFLNRASSTSNVSTVNASHPSPKQHMTLSALLNRPLPTPQRAPLKEDQSEYCELDYDTMESPVQTPTSNAEECGNDVLDASTSSMVRRLEHSSLTSLNSLKTPPPFTNTNTISQSCQDVSKQTSNTQLHWRIPRTDSAPLLPARKPSLPTRDSGCIADSSDYDQPKASNSFDQPSLIDAVHYRSSLIDIDNRPLTKELVEKLRSLLLTSTSEQCASFITSEDCRLLRLKSSKTAPNGVRSCNGLALLLLPHGSAMRTDLIERSRSLQFLCALSIVNGDRAERCAVLTVWIHLAYKLIKEFGNVFSFVTIMSALQSKALSSIANMWMDLENDVNITYNSKLIPWFQQIVQQRDEIPAECCPLMIPCIQPLLDLLSNAPSSAFLNMTSLSAQIESLWKWLEMGREWCIHSDRFQRATAIQQYASSVTNADNFLSTEFALRFLFGAKGCAADTKIRYQKLAALVDVLAEKAQLSQ